MRVCWAKRDTSRASAPGRAHQLFGRVEHGLARLLGLEDDRVPGLLEDLPAQVVVTGVGKLDDHRAVGELLDDALVLARPAGTLRRYPYARDARVRDLACAGPALDVRLHALARLELLVQHGGLANPVEPERARLVLVGIPAVDVPALAPVHQLVGLDAAGGELVELLLVVLDLEQAPARDRAGHHPGDLGVIALRGGDLEALLGRVLP